MTAKYKEHIKSNHQSKQRYSNYANHLTIIDENHSYLKLENYLEILYVYRICKKSPFMTTLEIYEDRKKNLNLILNEKSNNSFNPLFEQLLKFYL